MKALLDTKIIKIGLIAYLLMISALLSNAFAEEREVTFPQDYKLGEHYATINRGNIREELYTSMEAISAAKNDQPFPSGTVIVMEDYRNDQLYRYIVMEKREEWTTNTANGAHIGHWKFQWFNPDQSPKTDENFQRCGSCHASESDNDYVFTSDKMKDYQ